MGTDPVRPGFDDQRRRRLRVPASAGAYREYGAYVDLALQFGIATMVGAFGGYWLDTRLGSRPILTFVGTLAGAAAGFFSLYRGLMSMRKPKDSDQDASRR